eukprot:TRINITY_DN2656_c0_g1_i1.p1 TRINITY_DN2656_c0_g1~~TRINITY_DN2656_c0_g1_i1.p1  ORF type:complete len:148 (+),score=20.99 TRINITY_DN2656_c0_g1_i1:269-712(+)
METKAIIEKKLLRNINRLFDFYKNAPTEFQDHAPPPQGRLFIGEGALLEEQSRRIMYIGPPVGFVKKRWCFLFSDLLVFVEPDADFNTDLRPPRYANFSVKNVIPLEKYEIVDDETQISEFSTFELPYSFFAQIKFAYEQNVSFWCI